MEDDTFRIAIKARLKHGVLLEALNKRNWSQSDGARFLGINPTLFGRWINLKEIPRHLTEEQVAKLVELTGQLPDQLWPEYVRSRDFLDAPKTFEVVKDVDARRLLAAFTKRELGSPEAIFSRRELSHKVDEVLGTLAPREAQVIHNLYFDGKTHEEVGQDLSVTRERVRQIEAKALRKLRHPSRSRQLRGYLEVIEEKP